MMSDRISQLPEPIVHHILSFLKPRNDDLSVELVRMSVLSKTWFHLTASFPTLDFRYNHLKSRESFFKYVEYTTSRFCLHNVVAQRFYLSTTVWEPAELDVINRCIELVLNKGVKKLVLDISGYSSDMQTYRLPNILLSVSVLESLYISGCGLPSSLMVDPVKFKSLISLDLYKVPVDDEVIKYLTTSCPLLQDLEIRRCHGLKRFCVYGHQNLQRIWIRYDDASLERIDIEAPNLSFLEIQDHMGERGAVDGREALQINVASCKKLTEVTYIGHPFWNLNRLNNFLSYFPFIETFVLIPPLWTSQAQTYWDLKGIASSTKLAFCIYSCKSRFFSPVFIDKCRPLLRDSTHLKAWMGCCPCTNYPYDYLGTLWFMKLRLFLENKKGFKVVNLYIIGRRYTQRSIDLEKLKAIELPPYELEHVELQLDDHDILSAHANLLDAVLLCLRPQSLTLRSSFPLTDFGKQSGVVKFTYEKLLQQEDEGHTNIQIASPSSVKGQEHFRSLFLNFSIGAFSLRNKTVSFIKEEAV